MCRTSWARSRPHGFGFSQHGFRGEHGAPPWAWEGGEMFSSSEGFGVRRPLRFLAHKLELEDRQIEKLAKILDELKTELAAKGIEVITKPEWDMPGVGRFARIHDPEGNPIELWEPD